MIEERKTCPKVFGRGSFLGSKMWEILEVTLDLANGDRSLAEPFISRKVARPRKMAEDLANMKGVLHPGSEKEKFLERPKLQMELRQLFQQRMS